MDCAEIRNALARGSVPGGPRLDSHLRACSGCAELCAEDAALGRQLGTLSAVAAAELESAGGWSERFGALERDLERERGVLGRLRAQPTLARMAIALGAAALIAALVLLFKRRVDIEVYPSGRLYAAIGAYALALGACARVALRPLQLPALSTGYRGLVVVMAVLVPFAIAAAPAAHAAHPASLAGAGDDFWARALACFAFGGALALPSLGLMFALERGAHRAWFSALSAAGVAGLVGVIALELHCPITHPAHLIVGHATVAALALVGYAIVTGVRRAGSAKPVGASKTP